MTAEKSLTANRAIFFAEEDKVFASRAVALPIAAVDESLAEVARASFVPVFLTAFEVVVASLVGFREKIKPRSPRSSF